jgi:hypothetical protein
MRGSSSGCYPEQERLIYLLQRESVNSPEVYRTRGGERLAKLGIRRLRRQSRPELGPSPVVIFLDDCYAVLAVEELLAAVGLAVRQGLLPQLDAAHRPLGPL